MSQPDRTEELTARQGVVVDGSDPERLEAALELAFDYRGDVTVTRRGHGPVEGYVFDRRTGATPAESYLRLLVKDSTQRVRVAYADITEVSFTGRDTAEGKSFETWMKRYVEKKLAGEEASIHSEPLGD